MPRPAGWPGDWVQLPRDDDQESPRDVTAGGVLHWAPLDDPGVRGRCAALSAWLERAHPRLVVVDVSVETALLVRLHGVPVVSVVMPGRRTDAAHLMGYRASSALVAFSSEPAGRLVPGLPTDIADRVVSVGAVSRFRPVPERPRPAGHAGHVVVLDGNGGEALTGLDEESLRRLAPGWRWTAVGGTRRWVRDVEAVLRAADVVVTRAGQSGLADVAAHRVPAIVVPGERPFDEQRVTADLLRTGAWPAIVLPQFPHQGWPELLDRAARLDGQRWGSWCDGRAAERFAAVLAGVGSTEVWSA
ncbi:glycosyltransferase [Nocardioides nematodiphilus]|uniref:glycosyltransferase n=1 Tax=Nocardioides nematodiphilus TaxID=2849669 RepID=UPI001CD99158|nr:glycosyltransferase [Nocardioides nematodiphilus]MCA1984675.1 hypothetical protein [Nocardioides nematodiphilus]